jgi:DNA-directed RNA polymerase III subunit RPC3
MRLNFDKCTVFLRNQQLVKLAHRYIGETTSKVFEALLESFESFLLRCYDPMDSSTALQSPFESTETGMLYSTAQNIIKYLEPGLDLNIGLPLATTTNGVNGHVSSNNDSRKHVSKQPSSSTADNDNDSDTPINPLKRKAPDQTEADSVLKLEGHLKLLQSDPRHFVIRRSSGWTVPFKALTRTLMQAEIETTITARFGPVSARLIRILHTTYAADEKALAASAILKPKEVRATTNALLAAGLLATQEIPRDSNRTTNRLLWLYAYDPAAARRALLADAFRAMTRLLRRADAESGRVAPLLLKAERTDVVGHEEKYLTQEERRELMRLSETEMDLLASVGRIDDLVACLRDFAPLDDPFVGNRTRPEGDEMDDDE